MFTGGVFLVAFLTLHLSSQQDCQRGIVIHTCYVVLSGIRETGDATSPEIYRGIEPDISPFAITADRIWKVEQEKEC